MMGKILDIYNFLCINKKEETNYRAFDNRPNNYQFSNRPELKWIKEYELRGSDHFPIIIEDEKEVYTKQQQKWSI